MQRIDGAGRITIPKIVRDMLGWRRGSIVEVTLSQDGIAVRTSRAVCPLCGVPIKEHDARVGSPPCHTSCVRELTER